MVGTIASRWARLATSGTTPPKRACSSTLLAMASASRVSPRTMPTPVSSHEVSMPSTSGSSRHRGSPRQRRPHDERVDVAGLVVAAALRSDREPAVLVEGERRRRCRRAPRAGRCRATACARGATSSSSSAARARGPARAGATATVMTSATSPPRSRPGVPDDRAVGPPRRRTRGADGRRARPTRSARTRRRAANSSRSSAASAGMSVQRSLAQRRRHRRSRRHPLGASVSASGRRR